MLHTIDYEFNKILAFKGKLVYYDEVGRDIVKLSQ